MSTESPETMSEHPADVLDAPSSRAKRAIITHGCGARWTGLSKAHCAACHLTFTSVRAFDRHRHQQGDHGGCYDPKDRGLIERVATTPAGTYSYWGYPSSDFTPGGTP